jgi:hypothetical protein
VKRIQPALLPLVLHAAKRHKGALTVRPPAPDTSRYRGFGLTALCRSCFAMALRIISAHTPWPTGRRFARDAEPFQGDGNVQRAAANIDALLLFSSISHPRQGRA